MDLLKSPHVDKVRFLYSFLDPVSFSTSLLSFTYFDCGCEQHIRANEEHSVSLSTADSSQVAESLAEVCSDVCCHVQFLMGTNLLTGHTDRHWKAVRKGVAPAFSTQHMR